MTKLLILCISEKPESSNLILMHFSVIIRLHWLKCIEILKLQETKIGHKNLRTFLSFVTDMVFTLNDIGLQMALIFEQTLEEYKHVVELCKFWKFIHLTLNLIQ